MVATLRLYCSITSFNWVSKIELDRHNCSVLKGITLILLKRSPFHLSVLTTDFVCCYSQSLLFEVDELFLARLLSSSASMQTDIAR